MTGGRVSKRINAEALNLAVVSVCLFMAAMELRELARATAALESDATQWRALDPTVRAAAAAGVVLVRDAGPAPTAEGASGVPAP
jgi:hypothetical protein